MVVGALLHGSLQRNLIKRDELSKLGRYVFDATDRLNSPPPYEHEAVLAMAVEALGGPEDKLRPYLKQASLVSAGKEVAEILRALRDRSVLLDLANSVNEQLESCTLNKGELHRILDGQTDAKAVAPLSSLVGERLPDPPTGVPLRSLPLLTHATGGLFGMWAIAGEPAVGKSTLAIQVALHVAQTMPVVYYDFENGVQVMLHRIGAALGSVDKLKAATKNLYMRDSIRWIEQDLAQFPAPALIVVDSIQKVPTSINERRASLDKWIHRLEALKKRGYHVLILSEKDRGSYGEASMRGFKESGEIEYSADLGVQLLDGDGTVELHIVKNRHRPNKGHLCDLTRERSFWFKEQTLIGEDRDAGM